MTLSNLTALLAIITDAVNDIHSIYNSQLSAPDSPHSLPPTPTSPTTPNIPLDFPALDQPHSPSPSESLTTHPTVVAAITKIIAACGQMTCTVQNPFLTLCDVSMSYHLPACLRILEASHTVEVLRDAGQAGLHVSDIARRVGMDASKLGHILRLLATHHITREVAPDVFANNRISSMMDSGKDWKELVAGHANKYNDTNGVAAFVGLCTDELFKSSAYLTEAYLLAPSTKFSRGPKHTPFNFAFQTEKGYFGWLEEEEEDQMECNENPSKIGWLSGKEKGGNRSRLERFGKAMTGSVSFEAPGVILNAFPWADFPPGSTVVDVGGGVGSTTMVLAAQYENLNFVIQDREVVVEMGEKAWRERCPDMLDSKRVKFQVHDFFTPQPVKNPSAFFLRVILHDWSDTFARRILLRLREAAREPGTSSGDDEGTKLIIGDFVLPLACADDFGSGGGEDNVEGAERMLAHPPLLANLGKGSAVPYWMDLTMHVTFNSQERTLREIVTLALSAGWKVIHVTHSPGSLFGYIIAVPVPISVQGRARAGSGSALLDAGKHRNGETAAVSLDVKVESESKSGAVGTEKDCVEVRGGSRCGTPTFGSRVDLPSFEEAFARFGGVKGKSKVGRGVCGGGGVGRRGGEAVGSVEVFSRGLNTPDGHLPPHGLKPALSLKKKIPSPLSIRPLPPFKQTPTPLSPDSLSASPMHSPTSPRKQQQHQFASPPPLPTRPSRRAQNFTGYSPPPPPPSPALPFNTPMTPQSSRQQKPQLTPAPPPTNTAQDVLRSPPPIAFTTPGRRRGLGQLLASPTVPPSLLPTPESPSIPPFELSRLSGVLSQKESTASLRSSSPMSNLQGSDANDGGGERSRLRLRRMGSAVGLGVGGGVRSLFDLTGGRWDGDLDEEVKSVQGGDGNGIREGTVLAAAAKIEMGLRSREQ